MKLTRPKAVATVAKPGSSTYGSDPSGLICGYLFTPGSNAQVLDSMAAQAWLQASRAPDNQDFIWLHFNLSNLQSVKWLGEHLTLPEEYFDTLNEGPGSTRVEHADDSLIVVINDVTYDFAYDVSQISTLSMCVQRNCVVSARRHPLRSVDRLRVAVKAGENF
jgi:zinc transporter